MFSFHFMLISAFVILTLYVLFTNQIGTRSKIVIVVFLAILGIVLMNLTNYSNALVSSSKDAKQVILIPKDSLLKSSGNYSVSMWIYIEDWNYKFGEKKTIFRRESNSKKPHIYLDRYKNDVIIDFVVNAISGEELTLTDNYDKSLEWCINNSELDLSESIQCDYDSAEGKYMPKENGVSCKNGSYQCLDGTAPDLDDITCLQKDNEQSATLKNVPLQKWFNITFGFGDNHTDIYLNGKLVQTKSFSGVQYTSEQNDFQICPDGGYSGSISNTHYFNYLVSPDKAFRIYKEGHQDVVVGSLFGKYKTAVTFYEDNNERAKYYIT